MKLILESWRQYSSKIISERNNVDISLPGGAEWKWAESTASKGWDTGFRTARGSEYIFDGDTQTSLRNRSAKSHSDKNTGMQPVMPCFFMKDQQAASSASSAFNAIQFWNENFKVSSYEVVDVEFARSANEIERLVKGDQYRYLALNGPSWDNLYNIAKKYTPTQAEEIEKNNFGFREMQVFTFPRLFSAVYGEKKITILLKIKNGDLEEWVIPNPATFSYDLTYPQMGYLPFEFSKSNSKIVKYHAGNKITEIVKL